MREKNHIDSFVALLQALRNIDPEFPLHYAYCLAEISRDQGLSITDLSLRTELSLSTVSRIIGALSEKRQKGAPYGLVDVKISHQERRRKELYLTHKGLEVIENVCSILQEPQKTKQSA